MTCKRGSRGKGSQEKAGPIVALSPGAVGAGKSVAGCSLRRTGKGTRYGRRISLDSRGTSRKLSWRKKSVATAGDRVRDLTGSDLRNAILALAAADVSVTNDSGLMHVSAAVGTPTVAIFGPTSPWHWKPLNPVAAILEPPGDDEARQRARSEGNDAVRHRRTDDVAVGDVLATVKQVLAAGKSGVK
jgi:heptosyltransferase-2